MIGHVFLWCQVGGFTAEGAGSAEGRSWDFTLTLALSQDGRGDKSPSPPTPVSRLGGRILVGIAMTFGGSHM